MLLFVEKLPRAHLLHTSGLTFPAQVIHVLRLHTFLVQTCIGPRCSASLRQDFCKIVLKNQGRLLTRTCGSCMREANIEMREVAYAGRCLVTTKADLPQVPLATRACCHKCNLPQSRVATKPSCHKAELPQNRVATSATCHKTELQQTDLPQSRVATSASCHEFLSPQVPVATLELC